MTITVVLTASLFNVCSFANEVSSSSVQQQTFNNNEQLRFFNAIKKHCGKAYSGKIIIDHDSKAETSKSRFDGKEMKMFVRRCSEQELQIPFYIGEDASRTWLITKTETGLLLKHDHRHKDGSPDKSTMYGGHTSNSGNANLQSFPVDDFSKVLFVEVGLTESVTNTWQMAISPEKFAYRMFRQGREFKVEFDLTNPIDAPPAPWGYFD